METEMESSDLIGQFWADGHQPGDHARFEVELSMNPAMEPGAEHAAAMYLDDDVRRPQLGYVRFQIANLSNGAVAAMHDLDGESGEADRFWSFLSKQPKGRRVMLLHAVEVDEAWRGHGLGTMMMLAVPVALKDLIDVVVTWPWRADDHSEHVEELPRLRRMAQRAGYRPWVTDPELYQLRVRAKGYELLRAYDDLHTEMIIDGR